MSITYVECVYISVVIQHATGCAILASVANLALRHFSHYLVKGKIVSILSTNFVSHSKKKLSQILSPSCKIYQIDLFQKLI